MRSVHETPAGDADARDSVRFDATADLTQASAVRSAPVATDPTRGFDWRDGRLTVDDTIRWIYTELAAN